MTIKKISKKEILEFLKESEFAALSTVDEGNKPEVSTVYFGVDKGFNFYVLTGTDSKKYKNLQNNKKVAMVVSNKKRLTTVQIEGEAEEIKRVKKNSEVMNILIKSIMPSIWQTIAHIFDPIPPVLKMQKGDLVILKVTPNWIRWADFSAPVNESKGEYFQEFNFK